MNIVTDTVAPATIAQIQGRLVAAGFGWLAQSPVYLGSDMLSFRSRSVSLAPMRDGAVEVTAEPEIMGSLRGLLGDVPNVLLTHRGPTLLAA